MSDEEFALAVGPHPDEVVEDYCGRGYPCHYIDWCDRCIAAGSDVHAEDVMQGPLSFHSYQIVSGLVSIYLDPDTDDYPTSVAYWAMAMGDWVRRLDSFLQCRSVYDPYVLSCVQGFALAQDHFLLLLRR